MRQQNTLIIIVINSKQQVKQGRKKYNKQNHITHSVVQTHNYSTSTDRLKQNHFVNILSSELLLRVAKQHVNKFCKQNKFQENTKPKQSHIVLNGEHWTKKKELCMC